MTSTGLPLRLSLLLLSVVLIVVSIKFCRLGVLGAVSMVVDICGGLILPGVLIFVLLVTLIMLDLLEMTAVVVAAAAVDNEVVFANFVLRLRLVHIEATTVCLLDRGDGVFFCTFIAVDGVVVDGVVVDGVVVDGVVVDGVVVDGVVVDGVVVDGVAVDGVAVVTGLLVVVLR
jgi:hypothetical protein